MAFGALGGAMGGMMGGAARGAIGGGNGGSFAQKRNMMSQPQPMVRNQPKQMMSPPQAMTRGQAPGMQKPGMRIGQQMQRPPMMGGSIGPRPQMGGGFGQMIQQMGQMGNRMQQNPMETRGGYGRPPVGFAPDPNYGEKLKQWQAQPVDQPQDGGGMMRPQVQGPNGESPSQMGNQGGLAEMFRKMQMQQQQQAGGRGYNTGIAGGMRRPIGIAPQLSMMPQQMQQPQQPNPYGQGYGEEEQQYGY